MGLAARRFARAIRRAAWPGKPTRAAHRCWWRTTMPRRARTACSISRGCSDLPLEQRLSQLTQWVLDCERRGESYGLRLRQRSNCRRATGWRSGAPAWKPWRCTAYERTPARAPLQPSAAAARSTAVAAARAAFSARCCSMPITSPLWCAAAGAGRGSLARAQPAQDSPTPARAACVRIVVIVAADARRAAELSHPQRHRGGREPAGGDGGAETDRDRARGATG